MFNLIGHVQIFGLCTCRASSAFSQHVIWCQTVWTAVFTSAMEQEEAGTTACAEMSAEAVVTVLQTP